MNAVPRLATDRLTLRAMRMDDVDALAEFYIDDEASKYLAANPATRADVAAIIDRRVNVTWPEGMGSWVFELDGRLVGAGNLRPSEVLPGRVTEIGWRLDRGYWGKGLAGEAAQALLDYAWTGLKAPTVWAMVHVDNKPSLALADRLGFLDIGERPNNGAPHRVLMIHNPISG